MTCAESEDETDDEKVELIEDSVSVKKQWTEDSKNPDYNLIIIHAANIGFRAKVNVEIGSYLIHGFTQKVKENIEKNQNKTLDVI